VEEQKDITSQLNILHHELHWLASFTVSLLNRKSYTRQQFDNAYSRHEKIQRLVGGLSYRITELSGIDKITISTQEHDVWKVALIVPGNSSKVILEAIRICIQATNRAIGNLEDGIRTGKRDKRTGELIVKSETSGSEPPPLITTAKANWKAIENEFGITKNRFGKKINFVSGSFQRSIIFRDVEHSSVLANLGFSKPAVILAGSVIEELLRLYLEYKNISPLSDNFDGYIRTCEQKGLLKSGISRLSDSVRCFRNLVHLSQEKTKRYTISKAIAKGAVAAIFTIANDF